MANLTNYVSNKNLNLDALKSNSSNYSQNNNYTSNSIETYPLESEIVDKQIIHNDDGSKTEIYHDAALGQTVKLTTSYSPGQMTKTYEVMGESGFVRQNSTVYSTKDGSVLKVIVYDKDGGKRIISYFTDPLGNAGSSVYCYDANGNRTNGKTFKNGVMVADYSYQKNEKGEIVHISRDYGDDGGNGGKNASVSETIKDANGNVSKRTQYNMVDGKNDYSNRVELTYSGNTTKEIVYKNNKIVSTKYTAILERYTDSFGNTGYTENYYDENGLTGGKQIKNDVVVSDFSYQKNENGEIVHISRDYGDDGGNGGKNASVSETIEDSNGNVTKRTQYNMVDGKSNYSYRHETTYENGSTKEVSYKNNKVYSESNSYTDSFGHIIKTEKYYKHPFINDESGTVHIIESKSSPNGVKIESTEYDMTDGKVVNGSQSLRHYDKFGNVKSVTSTYLNGKTETHEFK